MYLWSITKIKFVLLAKRALSNLLEDMNSKTFRLLRTIRQTTT